MGGSVTGKVTGSVTLPGTVPTPGSAGGSGAETGGDTLTEPVTGRAGRFGIAPADFGADALVVKPPRLTCVI